MRRFYQFAIGLVFTAAMAGTSPAQDALAAPEAVNSIQLTTPAEYPSQPKALSVREQRQQIAMEKARHRRARLERNAWRGHQPLRPSATDLPIMRSNYVYPFQAFSYFPIYVR